MRRSKSLQGYGRGALGAFISSYSSLARGFLYSIAELGLDGLLCLRPWFAI
jgi:hypothetical protein